VGGEKENLAHGPDLFLEHPRRKGWMEKKTGPADWGFTSGGGNRSAQKEGFSGAKRSWKEKPIVIRDVQKDWGGGL